MKKNTVHRWIVLAVIFVVYNVVVFVVPFEKSTVFFISWFFTLAAIVAQTYVIRTAFYKGEGIRSKFYGFPIARIGIIYLISQMALGLLFIALGNRVKLWIPLVLYVILLGASVVGFVAANIMRDEVVRQDVKLKKDVSNIRALQTKVASTVQLVQDTQVRKTLEKFSEDLQFSDPVSTEALTNIETALTACVDELYQAVANDDQENALSLVQKAKTLLKERNRLCKLDKPSTH